MSKVLNKIINAKSNHKRLVGKVFKTIKHGTGRAVVTRVVKVQNTQNLFLNKI